MRSFILTATRHIFATFWFSEEQILTSVGAASPVSNIKAK